MSKPNFLLCVDAGNTLVKWCLHPDVQHDQFGAVELFSHPTSEFKPFEAATSVLQAQFSHVLEQHNCISSVLLCNVLGTEFEHALRRLCEHCGLTLHVLTVNTQVPVQSAYENPAQLGKDRWAACLAVSQVSAAAANLLVSFGTATTVDALVKFDLLDSTPGGWRHLGGFIVPGLHTMLGSLYSNTAELPQVELAGPQNSRGLGFWPVNTRQAIGEGVGRLQSALIESLSVQLALQQGQAPVVWFSGGLARPMLAYFPQACLIEHAVFKGLLVDYQCARRASP